MDMKLLYPRLAANLVIVLVEPIHPGNIGSAARAIKNMGCSKMRLVRPHRFPCREAFWRASSALDVLHNAGIYGTVEEAINDCSVVYATSSRLRSQMKPELLLRPACQEILGLLARRSSPKVAILFGREDFGLSTKSLILADRQIRIPASNDYPSLNLAMAVQISCYELYQAFLDNEKQTNEMKLSEYRGKSLLPTKGQLEALYAQVENLMIESKFLNPNKQRRMTLRLRNMLSRSTVDKNDVDLLLGMVKSLDPKSRRKK